jgi:predicted permease
MKIEDFLYWAAYAIPFILILVGASAEKLVDKSRWHWRHFYCGIDLMLAVLGAALVNVLDVAKVTNGDKRTMELLWTVVFLAASVVLLFAIAGLHQDWQEEEKFGAAQVILLGVASNGIGVALAYTFVNLKVKGLL